MPHYKDQSNGLHFLSEEDIANGGVKYLPSGRTQITDAEAEEIRLSQRSPNADIDAHIAELEAQQEAKMTPRAKREFNLGVIAALGLDPNMNPGTAELAAIQAQIVALRAQRK